MPDKEPYRNRVELLQGTLDLLVLQTLQWGSTPAGGGIQDMRQPIDTDESMFIGALVLQTAGPNTAMESITRQTLTGINPNLAVVQFQTWKQTSGQVSQINSALSAPFLKLDRSTIT